MLDEKITSWVAEKLPWPSMTIQAVSGDASFRQYYRVSDGLQTVILMLSPPDKEDPHPFVAIARQWLSIGLAVPEIYAVDWEQGLLLISDLGDALYSTALNEQTADYLYEDALLALIALQQKESINHGTYPVFDKAFMWKEMGYFTEWFLPRCLDWTFTADEKVLFTAEVDQLLDEILMQPQVVVHRDYHSRNLLVLAHNNPGVIDFQDAVIGPLMYDPVSLLKDAYISWPEAKVQEWLAFFWKEGGYEGSFETAQRWFDVVSLQRHIKVLGIFARLAYRDEKRRYLEDMPTVVAYICHTLERCPQFPFLRRISHACHDLSCRAG